MKKILQHLKNEWYRYGLETLVVIAGILVAFGLNNWNENQKADTELNAILLEVRKDLLADKVQLVQLSYGYERFVENLHILQNRGTSLTDDSLAIRISNMHYVTSFNAVMFGYSRLSNNPNTGRIPGELTSSLAEYYTNYGAGVVNSTNSENLSGYSVGLLRAYLIEVGFPISGFSLDPVQDKSIFRTVITDTRFTGILRNMQYNWGIQRAGFDRAALLVNKNIQFLETYFEIQGIDFEGASN